MTSSFGTFALSEFDESDRVLSVSGDTNSVSQQLKNLRTVFRRTPSVRSWFTVNGFLKTLKIHECYVWLERIFWPGHPLDQRLSAGQFWNSGEKKSAWTFASARWVATWRSSESKSHHSHQNLQERSTLFWWHWGQPSCHRHSRDVTKTLWTDIRRHGCLQRLVDSIRDYYPQISIIIADDSPGNGDRLLLTCHQQLNVVTIQSIVDEWICNS